MIASSRISRESLADDVLGAVSSMLPPGLSEDLKRNIDASVVAVLENLDIVTRSELEVQEAALRKARKKLNELELRVKQLEDSGNQSGEV